MQRPMKSMYLASGFFFFIQIARVTMATWWTLTDKSKMIGRKTSNFDGETNNVYY